MKKVLYIINFLLIFFVLKSISVSAQTVSCPEYCTANYPSQPVANCSSSDPGGTCTFTGFLCTSNFTQRCYCCSSTTPPTPTCTPHGYSCDPSAPGANCCDPADICMGYCQVYISPTPTLPPPPTSTPAPSTPTPTPSYLQCTGRDGDDPCAYYDCDPLPANSECIQHGGQCDYADPFPSPPMSSYACSPTTCRCGHSLDDCPYLPGIYEWTCKTPYPWSCSTQDENNGSVFCSTGKLVCIGGVGHIPCTEDDTCKYECGASYAYCRSGECYTPQTCGDIKNGPGVCIPKEACPVDQQWSIPDTCLPDEVCCSSYYCSGYTSHLIGSCFFGLSCPEYMPWDGIHIPGWVSILPNYPEEWPQPEEYTQCGAFESCCLLVTPTIIPRPELKVECTVNGRGGINSAIGCIPVDTQTNLLKFILPWAIGVAGGTSFILMIVAGFLIMTSSGNPQKAKAGKELLTAAITGLLMIIFSVYLLNLIGVRIFKIPGL